MSDQTIFELKEKLAALLEQSYARDEAIEQTINAKNMELLKLTNDNQQEISRFIAQIASLEKTLALRDADIHELSKTLEITKAQIQSDLHSISEYSVECPKCSGSPRDNMEISSLNAELADLLNRFEHLQNDNARLVHENQQQVYALTKTNDELHAVKNALKHKEEELHNSAKKTVEFQARISQMAADLEFSKNCKETLKAVYAEESVGNEAAVNAKKVAHAISQYCQHLTMQLRQFRKTEKRKSPRVEKKTEITKSQSSPPSPPAPNPLQALAANLGSMGGWGVGDISESSGSWAIAPEIRQSWSSSPDKLTPKNVKKPQTPKHDDEDDLFSMLN